MDPQGGQELRLLAVLRILGPVTADAKKTIWLVGMMGAGKSAVGQALAESLALPFVDSDLEIERRAGCSVNAIFARDGELSFRLLEAEVIREIAQRPQVVALGGGALAQSGMLERLRQRGTLVYLRAGLETLLARIGDAKTRPMLRDLAPEERSQRLKALQREREPSYRSAHITVDTDRSSPKAVAARIVEELKTRDASRSAESLNS